MQLWTDKFLEWATPRKAKNTLLAYVDDLTQFNRWLESVPESRFVNGVTSAHVEDFLTSLGHLSRQTLNRKLGTISVFFKFLVRQKVILANPCEGITRMRATRLKPVPLTREEIASLHAHATTLINRLILNLALLTGMRRQELTDLKVEQVDFTKLEIRVIGKGSVERTVLITQELADVLVDYVQGRTTGPVFRRPDGQPMSSRQVAYRLGKLAKMAGVHRLHPHLLRHTFASYMLEGGATIVEVQVLLGHASAATTAIYLHPTQSQKEHYETAVKGLMR